MVYTSLGEKMVIHYHFSKNFLISQIQFIKRITFSDLLKGEYNRCVPDLMCNTMVSILVLLLPHIIFIQLDFSSLQLEVNHNAYFV